MLEGYGFRRNFASRRTVDFFREPPLPTIWTVFASRLAMLRRLYPAQGPITAFVFLNTLEAFEHVPFDEGCGVAGGCLTVNPIGPEDRYHKAIETGRIRSKMSRPSCSTTWARPPTNRSAAALQAESISSARCCFTRIAKATAEELRLARRRDRRFRRIRAEATPATRDRFLEETRAWAISHAGEGLLGQLANRKLYRSRLSARVSQSRERNPSFVQLGPTSNRSRSRFQSTVGDLFVRVWG